MLKSGSGFETETILEPMLANSSNVHHFLLLVGSLSGFADSRVDTFECQHCWIDLGGSLFSLSHAALNL